MLLFKGKDWTILVLNNKGRSAVFSGSKKPQQTVLLPPGALFQSILSRKTKPREGAEARFSFPLSLSQNIGGHEHSFHRIGKVCYV
jgi:hypothetical protein